jgi:hypothetical protein
MTSLMRIILVTSTLILPLGGCASVSDRSTRPNGSPASFSIQKKLPGDRKAVFPEGVRRCVAGHSV